MTLRDATSLRSMRRSIYRLRSGPLPLILLLLRSLRRARRLLR